jgi:hypothetical protein
MNPIRAWCAVLAAASLAQAQKTLFLRPESFRLAPGDPVKVHLQVAGEQPATAWDDSKVRWFMLRGESTQENMDRAPAGAVDAAGSVALASPGAGAVAVGLDLKPVVEEIDAQRLREFTKARCDEALPESVKGTVRLERVQSCKALLRVGAAPKATYAATSEASLAAEVVTHMDPTQVRLGSDLPIVTSIRGEDAEDARVLITRLKTGRTTEVRTGDGGNGHVRIDQTGVWRLEFHHLERATAGSGAAWTLTTGTLIFEVPEQEAPR